MIHGVWTALVTPFDAQGLVDWERFKHLLDRQAAAGVAGVIPCGTTGEASTLTRQERESIIQTTVEHLRGSATQVIAGTGGNATAETVEFSRWACDQGVAGVLVVTPYYNKPQPAGLEAHFNAVADAVSCPVVLYNVPGRTGISLSAELVTRLAAHPRITALKEATGNLSLLNEILDALQRDQRPMTVLSGDDPTYLGALAQGAVGIISVASNLIPHEMVALQAAWDSGDAVRAAQIHRQFSPLFRDLFVESNPVPIKHALHRAGHCRAETRLPLAPISKENRTRLETTLQSCAGFCGGTFS